MSLSAEQTQKRVPAGQGDWVFTPFGRLYHLEAPEKRDVHVRHGHRRVASATLCGRVAFDGTDHPMASWQARACEVCVRLWESKA